MRISPTNICYLFFFFNDTATTEIYTLSLHDALPIYAGPSSSAFFFLAYSSPALCKLRLNRRRLPRRPDRKSTRLNSSHDQISYAVFCLKKKKITNSQQWSAHLHRRTAHAATIPTRVC